MERASTAIVFESNCINELEIIQQKLTQIGIANERVVVENEEEEKIYQIKVDLQHETKAFDCIDLQLLKNKELH